MSKDEGCRIQVTAATAQQVQVAGAAAKVMDTNQDEDEDENIKASTNGSRGSDGASMAGGVRVGSHIRTWKGDTV